MLCEECSIPIENAPYCKSCISVGNFKKAKPVPSAKPAPKAEPAQAEQPAQGYPYPYQYYYPYYNYPGYQYQYRHYQKKDGKGTAVISGTLLLLVGILGLISPLIAFTLFMPAVPIFGGRDITAASWVFSCFILPFIFSMITIMGGLTLMHKRNFQMGIIGAFFGILTWGFYFGSVISVIVLLMLISSYEEISKKTEGGD
jgi:hypothetical protein